LNIFSLLRLKYWDVKGKARGRAYGCWRFKVGGHKSEIRDQRTKDQRSEVRDQKSGVRGQKAEVPVKFAALVFFEEFNGASRGRGSGIRDQRSGIRGRRSG